MIRRVYTDLTPQEKAAATPDPKRLVSLGETTRFAEVAGDRGLRQELVTFETFVESEGVGLGTRCWYRFKDAPDLLVPQFELRNPDKSEPVDALTPAEIKAMRESLPQPAPPIPDAPSRPLFDRPNW